MMNKQIWKKLGLVYCSSEHISSWSKHSALTPTPFLRSDGTIRVFAGFRDDVGISRIGYVDIDPKYPEKIISVSKYPVLDIGRAGCFDDNGVILGDIIRFDGQVFMFYIGFQLVNKVKFLAFTGLAISNDDGDSFTRVSDTPLLDRHRDESYIAAIHSVIYEAGLWKIWYGAGDSWKLINGNPYPSYGIHYFETDSLEYIPNKRIVCIAPTEIEYRIGRPRVYRSYNGYQMHFTAGTLSGSYLPGIANSIDGKNWIRSNEGYPISLSEKGWDSRHLSYPVILYVNDRLLIFYNGNDMGRDGFGIAECLEPSALGLVF